MLPAPPRPSRTAGAFAQPTSSRYRAVCRRNTLVFAGVRSTRRPSSGSTPSARVWYKGLRSAMQRAALTALN
eukprot:12918266-Prorocentrum_lima.AAC.1